MISGRANGDRVPEGAWVAAALLGGLALFVTAVLSLPAGQGGPSLNERQLVGVWQYGVLAAPLGAVFGFTWPSWSWRWGLVIAAPLLVGAAATVGMRVLCQPGSICLKDAPDPLFLIYVAMVVPIPCAAALVGALVRQRGRRSGR